MNYLLDTHVFIWLDGEPQKLSTQVLEICADRENSIFLSVASIWEIQIKLQLGKLKLNSPLSEVILQNHTRNNLQMLSIKIEHILKLGELPDHHHDSFDRMLIAQAKVEKFTIITHDIQITKYDVERIW